MCVACTAGMPNASIPTPEPVKQRKQFGAYGGAVGQHSVVFVSKVSVCYDYCCSIDNCRTMDR